MGYVIKHSTSNVSKTRRKGNVVIGVDSDGYAKTSVSGLYNGVPPVEGKHNFVQVPSTGTPNFYCVDDTELINFANSLGAGIYTATEALSFLTQRTDIVFTNNIVKNIVTDGLVLDLNSQLKSSFLDNSPTVNTANTTALATYWNNSGEAIWNSNDTQVRRLFPNLPVFSMLKTTTGNSHIGIGSSPATVDTEYTYSVYVWIPSSNSAGMSGSPPYMRPQPANYLEVTLSYNGSTAWGSWPRDQWIRIEGTGVTNSTASGTVTSAYISCYLNTAGDKIYFTAPQFEQKSSATDFVNGTRSQNTTWYDLSGNGDAVAVNSPVFSNDSFTFDQTNEYFSLTNNKLNNISGSVTLMGVCKQGSTGSPHQTVLCTDINYRNGLKLMSRYHGAAAAWIGNSDGTGDYLLSSGVNITNDGKWHHLATTRDNSTGTLKIYVDGILKNSVNTFTGATSRANIAAVGVDYHSSGYYYIGNISSVKAYDQVLTDSEINQNYYGGPIVTDGLVLAMDAGNLVSYESGSTTTYSMTGSLSGSLVNGVGFSNSNGGSWVLDGTDDWIDLGNQSLISDDFCIDIWYQLTETKGEHYIFTTGYSSAGSILIYTGGIWLNSSATDGRMPGAPGGTINEITNITVERTNGVAKWYKNGIYQYSLNYSGSISANTNYGIGWAVPRNKSTAYMSGKFYSVKMYNKGFSASEVLQNYNAQKARFI